MKPSKVNEEYQFERKFNVRLHPFGYVDKETIKKNRDAFEQYFKERMNTYKKNLKEYNKTKDTPINQYLYNNLINREFTFSNDKINVLFGPNACGKTTILRTLAGFCGHDAIRGDGFPKQFKVDYYNIFEDDKDKMHEEVEKMFLKRTINPCEVDWDGSVVYYHNFENRHQTGTVGGLCGSVFTSVGDELLWVMNRNTLNGGAKASVLFNKLFDVVKNKVSMESLFKGNYRDDVYWSAYPHKFYSAYPNFDKEAPMTILLDEFDKGFDIINTKLMYDSILPQFKEACDCQLIIVTHSPLLLLSDCLDKYNIIDVDKGYLEKCKQILKI